VNIIGVKYCGGCNPVIDRRGLVRSLEKMLPPGFKLATDEPPEDWSMAVSLCGCQAACADHTASGDMNGKWICVGGETIDLVSVREEEIAGKVVEKIKAQL
jgi:hypothetical protein